MTSEAERLLKLKDEREKRSALVNAFVGRGVGFQVAQCSASGRTGKRGRKPQSGKYHQAITDWLARNRSGSRITRVTVGVSPSFAKPAFEPFVQSGQLRMVVRPRFGRHGYPAIYEKV
jgi:hypothetical protein